MAYLSVNARPTVGIIPQVPGEVRLNHLASDSLSRQEKRVIVLGLIIFSSSIPGRVSISVEPTTVLSMVYVTTAITTVS